MAHFFNKNYFTNRRQPILRKRKVVIANRHRNIKLLSVNEKYLILNSFLNSEDQKRSFEKEFKFQNQFLKCKLLKKK